MWNDGRTPRIHTKTGTCLVDNTANQQMHHVFYVCRCNCFMLTATSHSTKIWIMSVMWCETIGQLLEYIWKLGYDMSKTQPISKCIYIFHVRRYKCFMQTATSMCALGDMHRAICVGHTLDHKTICGNLERVEPMMHSCFGTIEHSQISPFTFCRDLLSSLMCLYVCVEHLNLIKMEKTNTYLFMYCSNCTCHWNRGSRCQLTLGRL